MTEYPDLQQIKRELGLLQKLYSLYNSVIENVNGYYDIPWVEVNIEKINQELQDYQNRLLFTRNISLILFICNIYGKANNSIFIVFLISFYPAFS